jgi:hypothetical protein
MSSSHNAPAPTPANNERRSFSHRTVYAGLAISLVLAMSVAVYIYFRYVRYERVAARHVPPGAVAALRVDLEKVVLYEPFRAHLMKLLDERPTTGPDPRSRVERLKRHTGIEIGVDTREMVLVWGPSPTDWGIIVGGMFPRDSVVPGVEGMIAEEGHRFARSQDGAVLVAPGGIAIAQASDGAVIIASSEARARASLPESAEYQRLGLTQEGPGGYALSGDALRALVPAPLRALTPGLGVLNDVARVRGDLTLGQDVTLTSLVELTHGTGEEALGRVRGLLGGVETVSRLPVAGGALANVGDLTSRLQLAPGAGSSVSLTGTWNRAEVDRAAARLAEWLRVEFGWR